MCVLSMKVPIRKKSGNLSNNPCIYIYIYIYIRRNRKKIYFNYPKTISNNNNTKHPQIPENIKNKQSQNIKSPLTLALSYSASSTTIMLSEAMINPTDTIYNRHHHHHPMLQAWLSLLSFVSIFHLFRQAFSTTSCVCNEMFQQSSYWSSYTCSSVWRGLLKNVSYVFVLTSPAMSRMFCQSYLNNFRNRR